SAQGMPGGTRVLLGGQQSVVTYVLTNSLFNQHHFRFGSAFKIKRKNVAGGIGTVIPDADVLAEDLLSEFAAQKAFLFMVRQTVESSESQKIQPFRNRVRFKNHVVDHFLARLFAGKQIARRAIL